MTQSLEDVYQKVVDQSADQLDNLFTHPIDGDRSPIAKRLVNPQFDLVVARMKELVLAKRRRMSQAQNAMVDAHVPDDTIVESSIGLDLNYSLAIIEVLVAEFPGFIAELHRHARSASAGDSVIEQLCRGIHPDNPTCKSCGSTTRVTSVDNLIKGLVWYECCDDRNVGCDRQFSNRAQ